MTTFLHAGRASVHEGLHIEPEVTTVRAVVGGRAHLPCDIEVPSPQRGSDANDGDSSGGISLILWYHGDSHSRGGIPIYSLDARDLPLSRARPFPSAEYNNRAYFDVIARPPLLKIEPVQETDAGEYRCRVDYSRQRTQNRIVYLDVVVPARDVRIRNTEGKILSGVIGPYDEGSHLVLICEATDAKPRPRVTWWRGEELLDDSDKSHDHRLVSNELVIKRLQRHDLKTALTCQAENTNMSNPNTQRTASVIIDMNLRPLDVRISTMKRPLSAGQETEVTCRSTGGRPPPQLTWWIGQRRLSVLRENVSDVDNYTSNTVAFLPSIHDNGKFLSCRADNPLLSDSSLEDGWTLNIHYVPQLDVSIGANMKHPSVHEGGDVYFECKIRANPPVTEIGWKFEGQPLYPDKHQGIIITNQSLVLQKVRRESRGHYQCVASNSEGEAESDKILLRIHYAPVCRKKQNLIYGVARDEDAEIPCHVESDPPPTDFKWALNNSVELFDVKTFNFNGTKSVVTYRPRYANSYGTLYCWASNQIGTQKEPCAYHVVPASPPGQLRACSASNETFSTILVECKPGEAGGLRQSFHLEIFNFIQEYLEFNLTQQDAPVFQVTNLAPNTKYIFLLYAANSKGRSNTISFISSTVAAPDDELSDSDLLSSLFSPVLLSLVAGISMLIVVVVIVIFIMRRRDALEKGNPPQTNLNEKNSGSCRSLKAPPEEIQLTQVQNKKLITSFTPDNSHEYGHQVAVETTLSSCLGNDLSLDGSACSTTPLDRRGGPPGGNCTVLTYPAAAGGALPTMGSISGPLSPGGPEAMTMTLGRNHDLPFGLDGGGQKDLSIHMATMRNPKQHGGRQLQNSLCNTNKIDSALLRYAELSLPRTNHRLCPVRIRQQQQQQQHGLASGVVTNPIGGHLSGPGQLEPTTMLPQSPDVVFDRPPMPPLPGQLTLTSGKCDIDLLEDVRTPIMMQQAANVVSHTTNQLLTTSSTPTGQTQTPILLDGPTIQTATVTQRLMGGVTKHPLDVNASTPV
ncbi:protein turtle-like [Varroa jacobsoni]|uniref:protein turtle-like n=1 Tax=Varroa jacobsoni TaxID=62625 RepID=UPI000BF39676|nr:protein turtle-like [Varroa jacobsoni]